MDLDETALIDVRGKQLNQVLKRSRGEALAACGGIALAVAATSDVIAAPLALSWAGVAALCYALRCALGELQRRDPVTDATVAQRSQAFVATVAATGLCWGVALAWVAWLHGAGAAFPLLALAAAACVLSLGAHAAFGAAGVAAAAATFLPPALAFAARLGWTDLLSALATLAIAGAIVFASRSLKGQLWEAATLRERTRNLASYLDQRREQVEKLNVELKTTQAKREQGELALRRTSADLGLVQGKAKALADTLERISPLCQVTGLPNRRHFDQLVNSEWRRAARDVRVVSMCIFDIDEFDEYVGAHGHQSGDALLKKIATTLKGFSRRAGDVTGRFEQTKLALLLPGCDVRNAGRMADVVRKRVESAAISRGDARGGTTVTIHAGVAMIKPTRAMPVEELLKRVETALYEARFQGGNRVVTYQPLSKLRVERWDTPRDGPLNEQSLIQKLLVWGCDTTRLLMQPGTSVEPEIVAEDEVLAIASGELKIEVEGHTMNAKPGDCVFIPQGVELALEVAGERPVLKFAAVKHR